MEDKEQWEDCSASTKVLPVRVSHSRVSNDVSIVTIGSGGLAGRGVGEYSCRHPSGNSLR